ncbi:MAG: hypothetical protein JO269_10310 [Burkholderiaceae bacterium]|nr:hypothetical protein [Burkholderiaceae bacterium]
MTLLQLHAAAVCTWMGVISAETVLELMQRDPASRRFIAAVHGWIDILFEGPLVALVLITGAMLLARTWPASPLLLTKVAAGMVGVIVNVICIVLVRLRVKASDDARVLTLTKQIRLTGLAIPFGLYALVVGFGYLH